MSLSSGTRLGHDDGGSALHVAQRLPAAAQCYENATVWRSPRRTPGFGEGGSPGLPAAARPRTHPIRLRVTALLVLGVFAAVNIATTVFSLGAYCLTTYGGNPFSGIVP